MAIGKTKQYNSKEFARILKANGFVYEGVGKGSHMHFRRGNELAVIPVTNCNKMLSRRYIKEFGLKF